MGNERFRVGVIGTSWWADLEHLPGLRARRDVDLMSLCGRNPDRLAALAAKFGVQKTFTDWRAMISGGGLDALVIATPNSLHHPQAMAAFEAEAGAVRAASPGGQFADEPEIAPPDGAAAPAVHILFPRPTLDAGP